MYRKKKSAVQISITFFDNSDRKIPMKKSNKIFYGARSIVIAINSKHATTMWVLSQHISDVTCEITSNNTPLCHLDNYARQCDVTQLPDGEVP